MKGRGALNKTRSRAVEWKRYETQIYLANRIIQADTPSTALPPLQLDHSYSQPPRDDRIKLRLHKCWEPPLRHQEPLTSNLTPTTRPWTHSDLNPLPTPTSVRRDHLSLPSSHYPWSDSDDEQTPPANRCASPFFPWDDSEDDAP